MATQAATGFQPETGFQSDTRKIEAILSMRRFLFVPNFIKVTEMVALAKLSAEGYGEALTEHEIRMIHAAAELLRQTRETLVTADPDVVREIRSMRVWDLSPNFIEMHEIWSLAQYWHMGYDKALTAQERDWIFEADKILATAEAQLAASIKITKRRAKNPKAPKRKASAKKTPAKISAAKTTSKPAKDQPKKRTPRTAAAK